MTRVRRVALLVAVGTLCAVLVGCDKNPEQNSGPDAYRHQAAEIPLDKPIPDEFDGPGQDLTDWKWFKNPYEGELKISVHFTDVGVGAIVSLYDRYGQPIASGTKSRDNAAPVEIVQALSEGKYFLRVRGADDDDKSEYTVVVSSEE